MKATIYDDLAALYEANQDNPNGPALLSAVGRLLEDHGESLALPAFAKRAGVSTRSVLYWIESGKIAATKAGEGEKRPRWFIKASELEKVQK